MKEKILRAAKEVQISDIGFTRAEVYHDLGAFLEKQPTVPFAETNLEKRINPFLIMPEARSVIVIVSAYHTDSSGTISEYARGEDYHRVLSRQMQHLIEILESEGYCGISLCDNNPLDERYLAYRAGLGFIGKNGFLIHPVYGSYVFIGCIITDCLLEESHPLKQTCSSCGKCIDACPSGALSEKGVFAEQCVSYLTQKSGELTADEEESIRRSGSAWGCDVCQKVCPYNKYAEYTNIYSFSCNLVTDADLTGISGRMFRKKYADRAFSWRGKKVLERNYRIIYEKKDDCT